MNHSSSAALAFNMFYSVPADSPFSGPTRTRCGTLEGKKRKTAVRHRSLINPLCALSVPEHGQEAVQVGPRDPREAQKGDLL